MWCFEQNAQGEIMAVPDWTPVDGGLFYAFPQRWVSALADALNGGGLATEDFALPKQKIRRPIPDVLTPQISSAGDEESGGGLAVAESPPRTSFVRRCEADIYAAKADLITVRHRHGDVVAVIEIVSPGNKGSRSEFTAFVQKTAALIRQNVHLLVIDLFPQGKRDPQGIHKAIWDEFQEEAFEFPPGKPLTLAPYDAGPPS